MFFSTFGFQINMEIVTKKNLVNKTLCSVERWVSWSRITVLVKFWIPRYTYRVYHPSSVCSHEFYIIRMVIDGGITSCDYNIIPTTLIICWLKK